MCVREESAGCVISGLASARWQRSVSKSLEVSYSRSKDLVWVTTGSKPCRVLGARRNRDMVRKAIMQNAFLHQIRD